MPYNNLRALAPELKAAAEETGLSYTDFISKLCEVLCAAPKETAPDASTVQSNA